MKNINRDLFSFISSCPTAFHTVLKSKAILEENGFTPLYEGEKWNVKLGKSYYVTRNGSSLIAFRVPAKKPVRMMLTAAHGDTPCLKIKENAENPGQWYVRFSTEKYGGMLCAPWMDRPLSVAGRVCVRTQKGLSVRYVDLQDPVAIIPNVAIHMNRNANEGIKYDAAKDMLPLFKLPSEPTTLRQLVARAAECKEENIVSTDLFLYNPQKGVEWNGLIAAPRLDDLQCVFGCLRGFVSASATDSLTAFCLFDNEEVGSTTKQGAASTFLPDTLTRISAAIGLSETDRLAALASSMMLSCDNAHAIHPNHPELSDPGHAVKMNGGVVIKYNANQKYTSDAVSAGIFKLICERAGVPTQEYANRADMPGGSTLGNIANTQLSLSTVDIGLAQLAMHSSYETAGAEDTGYLAKAVRSFYECKLTSLKDGGFFVE